METQKQKALKRLTALESEAKQLRKIIEFPESDKPIMERIKSWEDVCSVLEIPDNSASIGMSEDSPLCADIKSINAYMKLILITRALNEGWEPDWSDSNQTKYSAWFNDYKTGFGFSGARFAISGTRIRVSAPAFALNPENLQHLPQNNFYRYTTIF